MADILIDQPLEGVKRLTPGLRSQRDPEAQRDGKADPVQFHCSRCQALAQFIGGVNGLAGIVDLGQHGELLEASGSFPS